MTGSSTSVIWSPDMSNIGLRATGGKLGLMGVSSGLMDSPAGQVGFMGGKCALA